MYMSQREKTVGSASTESPGWYDKVRFGTGPYPGM